MLQALNNYFKVTEYGVGNKKVIFIFGGWKFNGVVYQPLLGDLVKRGYKCVLYVPKIELIAVGTPYSEIVAASHAASRDASIRVIQEEALGAISFASLGVSFGTIFAAESAKACREITKLLLFAPFGDFTEHVRLWPTHRYFSKVLASQPTLQKESGEVLNQVGLHKELSLLEGRQVLIAYAENDISIHTKVTEDFLATLQENRIDVTAVQAKGGHIRGIFKNLFINKVYIDFLISN